MANEHYSPEMREELDEQYEGFKRDSERYKHDRDWYDLNERKVDMTLVRNASKIGVEIGAYKLSGQFDEIDSLENKLINLLDKMSPDTKKAFKRQMHLERLSPAGERVFDDILVYLDLSEMTLGDRRLYNQLREVDEIIIEYYDERKPVPDVVIKRYEMIKSQLTAAKMSSRIRSKISRDMKNIESRLSRLYAAKNTVARKQCKSKTMLRKHTNVSTQNKTAPSRSRRVMKSAKSLSFMDRIVKISGVKLKKR